MALVTGRSLLYKRLFTYGLNRRKTQTKNLLQDILNLRQLTSGEGISDTTIIVQNGVDIQELPLAVKKVSGVDASHLLFGIGSGGNSVNGNGNSGNTNNNVPEERELEEIVNGFRRCNSFNEILKLFEVVPSRYVNSSVAFRILKRMAEIDSMTSFPEGNCDSKDVSSNFTKTAVFNQLMGVILAADEPRVLVDCLKLMNQDFIFKKYLLNYEDKLKERIMVNVVENKMGVDNICSVAKEFYLSNNHNEIDKLWMGITEDFKNVDHTNIMNVYRVLPYFKKSRNLIGNFLQRKMVSVWWNMSGKDIAEVIDISKVTNVGTHKLLQILGRWLNTKIHSVSEDELFTIINGFKDLDFCNVQVITALERYAKVKGMYIQNANLFASIMDYCLHFRIRSSVILEKCCDYFIRDKHTLSPPVMKKLFVPFGMLNYTPTRGYEFWKAFEEIIENRFTSFNPEQMLDIMLGCVYLEKYPINFINSIFNPYFLDELQITSAKWEVVKNKLKIFDQAMTLECKPYRGPLLYRDLNNMYSKYDERIKFIIHAMKDNFTRVTGSEEKLLFLKNPRLLPVSSFYIVDVLIAPEDGFVNANCYAGTKNPFVALLIHVPEHYTRNDGCLIGPQVMRKRHFEKIGLKVIDLDYLALVKLRDNTQECVRYIKDSIHNS